MEISNEVGVDPFAIGPSSCIGRTIAFRVLFCKSISHFRRIVFQFLLYYALRFRNYFKNSVVPFICSIHPKNPQGILVMVTSVAFLLQRYSSLKVRAKMAYRRNFWRNMMKVALTYEEWAHAAKMLDKENPKVNESHLYDEELVKNKLQELRIRREKGSMREIMFCMRADLFRNLGNMCNSELHKGRLRVPKLIKEYIDEVSAQLRMVCESDCEELLLDEKLSFMNETRHAFGRTALLLSGGASLGAFHVGVVKTLVEHKLLPRVVAGSSVGSVICSIVATKSWPELQSFFQDSWHSLKFFDQMGGVFTVFKRIMTRGAVHEIRQLQMMLRHLTNNLTFQEAYDLTGRILAITVCSPRKHEPPRCLNYLTSPHVVIWSAVTASCAFPGLFEAQELMAKDRKGELVPYHPSFDLGPEASDSSTRRWRDGSLEIDLPMMQLKELFNVNHFIVSQANPHIAPLLRLKELVRAYGGNFAAKLAQLVEMEVKHRCNQILELGFPLGGIAKLFAQDWEGDVTVVMPATLAQYSKIIQNPSRSELQKASNQGRRCTWEKLSAIKANCGIELALDECVSLLNHMRRLKRSAVRAAALSHGPPSPVYKRIPSWYSIARENSTGSISENALADLASPRHLSSPLSKNSTSVGETVSGELGSWTRLGGPLMRTSSSDKFVDFLRRFDSDRIFENKSLCRSLKANIPEISSDTGLHQMNLSNRSHSLKVNIPEISSDTGRSLKANIPEISSDTGLDQMNLSNRSSSLKVNIPEISSDTGLDQMNLSNRSRFGNSRIVVSEGDLLQTEMNPDAIFLNVVKKEDLAHKNRSCGIESDSLLQSSVAEDMQLIPPENEMDTSSISDSDDV